MVSQEELEYAIARFKAREAGQDFTEAAPITAPGVAVAVADDEELSAEAYQVEEDVEEVEAFAQAEEETGAEYTEEGVPHHVQSMSDSSLIELGDDAYDPDRNN